MGEMLTFVKDERGRPAAQEGKHDDCVMALAIAHHIRPQQSAQVQTAPAAGNAVWTADMWDDFNRAGEAERAMLLKLWGSPKG